MSRSVGVVASILALTIGAAACAPFGPIRRSGQTASSCETSSSRAIAGFVFGAAGIGTTAVLWSQGVGEGDHLLLTLWPGLVGSAIVRYGVGELRSVRRCRAEGRRARLDAVATAAEMRPLRGTVTGLSGTLLLAEDDQVVSLTRNGAFRFPFGRSVGAPYEVVIDQQPDGQVCRVHGARGVVDSDGNRVRIVCEAAP